MEQMMEQIMEHLLAEIRAKKAKTGLITGRMTSDLKVCDNGTLIQILCFWALSIVLSLSKNTVLFILQNTTFRRLGSVSVFR
jgi:hypothetical protein